MMVNPYQTYQQNSISTLSAKGILVRLHEKALMELQAAQQAWENEDLSSMRPHVQYVQDIISCLRGSVDGSFEVSGTLVALYNYYLVELAKIFINPTEKRFQEMYQFLSDWKETWSKAPNHEIV
ncbi:flagellar protein FliS [Alicyclobacillus tolerans]|uniref:flagellar export chaperone FliS n=1 Tax=Alicyclobacillus tolerans TaxID=90970 RepID=UPI001F237E2B|nr:flagellar export chaperone FliS [Alicyclobacillus tolerans]MCF8567761.1 flagellar protein FliS [Alicyclobacillus tolerans]